jgi:gas vesicle protein
MNDFFSFVGGAVLGAAIGAGIVIFTTPKSGDETRQDISMRWNTALAQGKQAAKQREQELWAEFNTRVKAPAGIPITLPDTPASAAPGIKVYDTSNGQAQA